MSNRERGAREPDRGRGMHWTSHDTPRPAILGFELGVKHLWWARLEPQGPGAARWAEAGKLAWGMDGALALLERQRDSHGATLAVIEFPDDLRGGYGRDRSVSWGGALLELAGVLDSLARRAGLRTLCPYVSDIRRWAAEQQRAAGGVFNWQRPDNAIRAWFEHAGAGAECFGPAGALGNRDKRDAMLAAEYSATMGDRR